MYYSVMKLTKELTVVPNAWTSLPRPVRRDLRWASFFSARRARSCQLAVGVESAEVERFLSSVFPHR